MDSAKGHTVLEEGLTYSTMFFSQHCIIRHACVDLNRWLQTKGGTANFTRLKEFFDLSRAHFFHSCISTYSNQSFFDLLFVANMNSQYKGLCGLDCKSIN